MLKLFFGHVPFLLVHHKAAIGWSDNIGES